MFSVFLLAAVSCFFRLTNGCMCAPTHPQEDMCQQGSFVALVKVRSESYVKIDAASFRSEKSANLITTVTRHDELPVKDDKQLLMRVLPTAAADDVIVDDVSKDKEQFGLYIRYRVKMFKTFKGIQELESAKAKYYVYTSASEGTCGRKLKLKDTYLIFGSIVNGRLIFGLCDHVIQWKSVSKMEKRNIRDNLEEIDTICNSKCDVISCLWSDCVPKSTTECTWSSRMEKLYGSKVDRANFVCVPNKNGRCDWGGTAITKIDRGTRRRRHSKASHKIRDSSKRSKKQHI